MIDTLFSYLAVFEDTLWVVIATPMILLLGLYLTISSNFFQLRKLPLIAKNFWALLTKRDSGGRGVHPLQAFFASIGGCVGLGNIAGISTAVQLGGPGALFWIWMASIAGMLVKYGEVFLGIRYRVPNETGGYNGGPMYFLAKAFRSAWLPGAACVILCIYGVEIYQFRLVTESIANNWNLNYYAVIAVLLGLVLFAGSGGVRRVGNISGALIPLFVFCYVGMVLWILIQNLGEIPNVFGQVFSMAFSDSAMIGGFAGSTLMLTISHGVRRACYCGDLGIGYASVIHSESNVKLPQQQASLVIFELFLDTFIICTSSVVLVLVTGVWHSPIGAEMMVQTALSQYFPYMDLFMPVLFFLLGYSTINAYFCVGLKCADFLSPKRGRILYFVYAVAALLLFSFVEVIQAQMVMTIASGLLLIVNCLAIFKLRHEISYDLDPSPADSAVAGTMQPATEQV